MRRDTGGAVRQWVQLYYWATIGFALADWLYDVDIRLTALEGHPVGKALYYFACIGIAVLMRVLPNLAGVVALAESSLNLLLLILGLLIPYYGFIDHLASGGAPAGVPITSERMINFLLSGAMWAIGYLELRARR